MMPAVHGYPMRGPIMPGWRWFGDTGQGEARVVVFKRESDALCVLTSIHIVDSVERGGLELPHWHVSVTCRGFTATDQQMEEVRAAFNMGGAEEDNHGPGVARHLWLLCGQYKEPECPCKQDEERTVEGARVRYDVAPGGVIQ